MEGFSKDQRVHVEYDGTVIQADGGFVFIRDGAGNTHYYKTGSSVQITAVAPENWPPQPGDIWEAGGYEWFFRRSMLAGEPPVAVREDGNEQSASRVRDLGPVLVRRRGR